jgi:hypothetical protein
MANNIQIIISAVDRASGVFKKTENSLQRMAQTAQITGAAMTAAITVPLTMVANKSIEAASGLAEALNKSNVAFASSSAEMEKWAEGGARAFGMSKRAALESAGSFGLMLKSLGMAEDRAKDMSKSMVELAADLASINNIGIEEAFIKLQAGLSGEAEPLRRLGVNLLETTVQAKAMEMGLAATTKELTQQDKVLARYALIMEQTAASQGDFVRTSGDLANSQRIMAAEFENASAALGEKLLPFKLKAVQLLTEMATAFSNLPDPVMNAVVVLGALAAAAGPLLFMAGSVAQIAIAIKGFGGAAAIIATVTTALKGLALTAGVALGPVTALIVAVSTLIALLKSDFGQRGITAGKQILAMAAGGIGTLGGRETSDAWFEGTSKALKIPGFASGGSFTVPAGYKNDSFLMGVSSGEHVSVNPAGRGGGNLTLNITMPQISGATARELTDQLLPHIRAGMRKQGLAA